MNLHSLYFTRKGLNNSNVILNQYLHLISILKTKNILAFMLKTSTLRLLFFISCFLQLNHASASYNVWGAEMKYNWYNNDTLQITVTVYSECITSGGSPSSTIAIRPDCTTKTSVVGTLVKGLDVTPVCKKSCTRCSSGSCAFPFGITRSTITTLVSLSKYKCCNYTFSWNECCSPATNINSTSTQVYLESSINTCYIKNNNSPVFQEQPVFLLTRNECVDRMQSVSINKGDSIVYSLVNPLIGAGSNAKYNGSFSSTEPLTYDGFGNPGTSYSFGSCKGFHYNSSTGELQFKPTKDESTELSFKAEQWHKDSFGTFRKVGEVTRTFTMAIVDTTNSPPSLTDGYQGTGKRVLTICSGRQFSMTLVASDPDKDSVSLDWATAISGASYKNGSGTYIASTFGWIPKASDIRKEPYALTVTLKDNHCPLPSTRQENFLIYVVKGIQDTVKINKLDSGCGKYYLTASADTAQHYNYKWYINGVLKSSTKTCSYYTAKNGTYQIDLRLSNTACTTDFYDSVVCKTLPNVNAGTDLNICPNAKGTLNGSGQGTLSWLGGKAISSLTDMHATVSPDSTTQYILKATNGGCNSYDTVKVNVSHLFLKAPSGIKVCGKSTLFQQKLSVTASPNAHYQWSPDTVLTTKEDSSTVTVRIKKPVTFTITASDALGCSTQGKITVNVNRLSVTAGTQQNICPGDSVQLGATIIGTGISYAWKKAPGISNISILNPYVKPASAQWYQINVSDTFGCKDADSVLVNVYPKISYGISTNPLTVCKGSQGDITVTGGGITSYKWSPTNEVTSSGATATFTPTASRKYYVTLTSIYGCKVSDSVKVNLDNDCVYPGDANHDKTANYLDLLNIGIGYANTGPVRQNASNTWQPQSCSNWGKTTTIGAIEYKHLDANGDGIINNSDKDAIISNYGKSHAKTEAEMGSRAGNPPLFFKFSKDTFRRGENVSAALYLGNSNNKISAVYGVAVKYNYYNYFIEAGTFGMAYNCDFFCNTASLNIVHNNIPYIESSVVNTDHTGINGNGKIADITYTLSSDSTLYPNDIDTIRLAFNNALVIDKDGNSITIDPQAAQAIVVKDRHSGIESQLPCLADLSVYPNPFNKEFSLNLSLNKAAHVSIICLDVLGRETGVLLNRKLGTGNNSFNFKDEDAGINQRGIYFIKILVDGQVSIVRLIKI